ncbi:hypothetical protein PIB30_053546 [Stylosanthes scabra]|uniref:Uncharacterized protein n=1 Tax=Stylosanthes scabra TaxID=79078 RepID=A0ABU6YIP9_9FABA|nr:hypothetical protein [Stylosanthes scabra]
MLPKLFFLSLSNTMAPKGYSRRPARENAQGERVDEVGADAQAGQVPQEEEDLHRLNRDWHIAGALRERVLLPRRCSFLMPVPDKLMPFMIEAGFGHAILLRDLFSTRCSFQHLWSVGGRRLIRSISRGVSAPSLCRMWRTT